MTPDTLARFRTAYGEHRAAEGRGRLDSRRLPYITEGPHASAWRVRARTYETFIATIVMPRTRELRRALRILDAGAGNGWLCHRLTSLGHEAVALDLRWDDVDGLRAPGALTLSRVAASFQQMPLRPGTFDIVAFNASLHYATSLEEALAEATALVRSGGRIAILDSPFYSSETAGTAMVVEKHANAAARFGDRAADLLALPFIEFLTVERLEDASRALSLRWLRRRVRYPWRYEIRPLMALLRGMREPSRFDVWEAVVP